MGSFLGLYHHCLIKISALEKVKSILELHIDYSMEMNPFYLAFFHFICKVASLFQKVG